MDDIYIPTPKVHTEGAIDGFTIVTPIERVNYDRDILTYYKGAEFPMKGFAPSEVVASINIVKAIFIGVFRLRLSFISLFDYFCYVGEKAAHHTFLKDQYRMEHAKEIDRIVVDFIFTLTSDRNVALRFARVFSHLIEYDNAYRLRLVDLASETTKEKLLKSPGKEINRLVGVLAKREIQMGEAVVQKFRWVSNVLRAMLWVPKFRKAFKYAIYMADWEKLCYDNIDKYWVCLRTDYNFMGMNYDDRMKLLKDNGYSIPVQDKIKV